jgi:hypothetical protein
MSIQHLTPFQVDPNRVNKDEIKTLVNKIKSNTKVSEIQQLFDSNISLCAFFLKTGYIKYNEIYFLSTSLIDDEYYRPDYICCCYHPREGVSWYAIICAGSQDRTWEDDLSLTNVGKVSFDRLNYCVSNLGKSLLSNKIIDQVIQEHVYGLLIIGQDREFFRNHAKQKLKREINQNTALRLRTYGSFLRHLARQKKDDFFGISFDSLANIFRRKFDIGG